MIVPSSRSAGACSRFYGVGELATVSRRGEGTGGRRFDLTHVVHKANSGGGTAHFASGAMITACQRLAERSFPDRACCFAGKQGDQVFCSRRSQDMLPSITRTRSRTRQGRILGVS